ncbi:MAG: alpha/beta hydrolase [Acidobacteria bacterium]|nr:alpha/beta hydrolase [Acidobacteriota bacterium]
MASGFPLVLAAGLLGLLWAGQRRLLYLPSGGVGTPQRAGLERTETFRVTTADGVALGVWRVAPAGVPRATVIVFNGNAGNRSFRAPLARGLTEAGYAVVLFDYRGYGDSGGSPSEDGLAEDARAVLRAVRARPEAGRRPVVFFGESLGTGVAVRLAAEEPPAALVLRSPFTSITDVAAHHYFFLPVRRLLWDRFDALSRISQVRCPVLVVAGDRDRVVPFALSQRLFAAAPAPKHFVTVSGADHNDADLVGGPPLMDAMLPWLAQIQELK